MAMSSYARTEDRAAVPATAKILRQFVTSCVLGV